LVPEATAAAPGQWRSREFPHLRQIVMLGSALQPGWIAYDEFRAGDAPASAAQARPEDDALILYTSGSSARPKAVRLQHYGVIENGFNIGERMGLGPDDRVLLAPPLFWSYGAANALPATLTHGATLVLQGRFEPGEWIGLIERHRCTAVYTLPSMTGAVLRHPAFRPERVGSLRTGLMIGSPEEVRIAAEELGAAQICNIYGSTEIYGNCCVTPCDWPLARRMASQGPPLPGVTLRIVDPDSGCPLPPGETGALDVAGFVTPGYGGASAQHNAAAFTADGYFRTGDLGFVDAEGGFHFVARDADIIKRAGINVSPAEIEARCCGTRRSRRRWWSAPPPASLARRSPLSCQTRYSIRRHCASTSRPARATVPDHIEIRPTPPVTETGKLFRRALKEEAQTLTQTSRSIPSWRPGEAHPRQERLKWSGFRRDMGNLGVGVRSAT
jgi:fatty-acyl-CoA synthase